MVLHTCKYCGAPGVDYSEAQDGIVRCHYCGNLNDVPGKQPPAELVLALSNADNELFNCRFEAARESYSKVITMSPKDPQGYFGRALAKFKIKYLKDERYSTESEARYQPICYGVTDKLFSQDADYLKALELAMPAQREQYSKQAADIDKIISNFQALKSKNIDYDVFICCKVTDDVTGQKTRDAYDAQRIYVNLQNKGFKPFFSEMDMGDFTGSEYEAVILYALYMSESMLIVCSNEDYLNTPWVKNEYSRFLSMTANGYKSQGSLTFVYKGKPIEQLPDGKRIQGIDRDSFGSSDRIADFVRKFQPQAQAATKFCASCGAEAPAKNKFCPECGGREFFATHDEYVKAQTLAQARKEQAEREEQLKKEQAEREEQLRREQQARDEELASLRRQLEEAQGRKAQEAEQTASETEDERRATLEQQARAKAEAERQAQQAEQERAKAALKAATEAKAREQAVLKAEAVADKPHLSANGDKLTFGSYPQSRVQDVALLSALNSLTGALPTSAAKGGWTDYGYYIQGVVRSYMWYIDVVHNGAKYRGVYFTTYRSDYAAVSKAYEGGTKNNYQIVNGYETNNVYWFKWEPIIWRVLSRSGNKAFVLADNILDSRHFCSQDRGTRMFNGKKVDTNNYAASDIRKWLNEGFYNSAFTDAEKRFILPVVSDSGAGVTELDGNAAADAVVDNVFLLNIKQVVCKSYGFSSSAEASDTRMLSPCDYAMCQGAYVYGNNCGYWWLRSPRPTAGSMRCVSGNGDACYGFSVCNTSGGVAPALYIYTNEDACIDSERRKQAVTLKAREAAELQEQRQAEQRAREDAARQAELENQARAKAEAERQAQLQVELKRDAVRKDEQEDPCIAKYFKFYLNNDGRSYVVQMNGDLPESVVIPESYKGLPVTSIAGRAFSDCRSLTSIVIPNGITKIGAMAFSGCSGLTSITIPSSVTSIEKSAFADCTGLQNVYYDDLDAWCKIKFTGPDANPMYHAHHFYTRHGDDWQEITTLKIPDNISEIGQFQFFGFDNVTSVTIPDTVTLIGDFAFHRCRGLRSVTLSSNITRIGVHTFCDCSSLMSIMIPKSVTSIDTRAFAGCSSLHSLVIPNNVLNIGVEAFYYCHNLQYVTMPKILAGFMGSKLKGIFGDGYRRIHFTYTK